MSTPKANLGEAFRAWFVNEPRVESVALFGSAVWADGASATEKTWSDFDFHILASECERLERIDWSSVLPDQQFCLCAPRPATGGVRKVTVIFASGQVDLVVVPAWQMRLVRVAFRMGLQRRHRGLQVALNEMSTCLASGFCFWKGQEKWGDFYGRIAREMPGVRLNDDEIAGMSRVFLSELLWVLQKIQRGEFSAAQHALHRQLGETNFRLLRELRLRRKQPLPSFGLGRRVEKLLTPAELMWVKIDAKLDPAELRRAALQAYAGMRLLMTELAPSWRVPPGFDELVRLHGGTAHRSR